MVAVSFSLFLETEVICVALLLAAWHFRRRPWVGPVLLGLACAFKQYSWFFVPFFALEMGLSHGGWAGWRQTLRYGALAAVAFLAPNVDLVDDVVADERAGAPADLALPAVGFLPGLAAGLV